MKALKPKSKFFRLTIDMDPEPYAKLKAKAARNERTPSKEAKVMLVAQLELTKEKSHD